MLKKRHLPPERSLGNQVRRCHRMFDRALSVHLAPHDLNAGFWYYLRALWAEDGLTQKQLSDITSVTESTTVTMIEMMVKRGLVVRSRDPQDRRKLRVSLTVRGRDLEKLLMPLAFKINASAAADIPSQEIESCLSVLMRLSDNLQRHGATCAEMPGNHAAKQKTGRKSTRTRPRPIP
jgi:MarR family transcriptional regulator, organic hydroperoxide resistance regulator